MKEDEKSARPSERRRTAEFRGSSRAVAALAAVTLLVSGSPVHPSSGADAARGEQAEPTEHEPSLQQLLAMARHEQPATRLRAVAALGNTPRLRDEPSVKRAAALALFAALNDGDRSVRVAALLSLVSIGGWDYDRDHAQWIARVSHELAAWAADRERDAAVQRSLGLVYLLTGEPDLAANALEISLELDPAGESTRYMLGLARMRQQRAADAGVLFRQVAPSDPYYPNAQEQLKQIQ